MAENGGKWQKMAENGFPRVSRHGHRGDQAGNGRKWSKNGRKKVHRGYLVGNGFPRVSRRGHRGGPEDHGQNGRKWLKMAENGRKWQKMAGNGRKWQEMAEKKFTAVIW